MKIIEHNKHLIQFEFIEKLDRVTYTTSAFLWKQGDRGILIDAGYFDYGLKIKHYLLENNITIDYLIITHYHRDHAEGSLHFKEAKLIASDAYQTNFLKCQNLLKTNDFYKEPDILVSGTKTFNISEFKITIISTPGHTPCSLSVIVNDDYLFVSDLILEDINEKMIIPYVDLNSNPSNHLRSLRKLQVTLTRNLMLSHGKSKFNCDNTLEFIERIFYLERFIEQHYDVDLQNCLMRPINEYAMVEIHKLNMRNAKKVQFK